MSFFNWDGLSSLILTKIGDRALFKLPILIFLESRECNPNQSRSCPLSWLITRIRVRSQGGLKRVSAFNSHPLHWSHGALTHSQGNTEPGIVTDPPHPLFFYCWIPTKKVLSPNISKQNSFSEKVNKSKVFKSKEIYLSYIVFDYENEAFMVFQACENLIPILYCACTAQETKFQKSF